MSVVMDAVLRRKLRDAWYGPHTAAFLAQRYGLPSAQRLRNFWQQEKTAGRLPSGCRPHFADVTTPPLSSAVIINDGDVVVSDAEIDCSEELAERTGMRIPAPDPLLAALRAAHGGDRFRRLVLRVPDDRKELPASMATPAHALRLARRHDAFVADFARRLA